MRLNIAMALLVSLAGACGSTASRAPDGGGGIAAGTGGGGGKARGGTSAAGAAGTPGVGGSSASGGSTGLGGGGSAGTLGPGGVTGSGGSAGGGKGGGGGAGAGGVPGSAGRGGATGVGGAGGGASPCQAVLALDRSCTTPADCFGGAHVTNCCGQLQFIGFRMSEQTRFPNLEAQCAATYPQCECAPQQPLADDGSRLRRDEKPAVTCQQGVCTTFVNDCGRPCASGTTCFSCSNRTSLFAACTTKCTSSTPCTDPGLPLCQMGSSGNTAGMFCTASNVACDTR